MKEKSIQNKDILEEITSQNIAIFNNPLIESRNMDNFLAEKINQIIRVVNKTDIRDCNRCPEDVVNDLLTWAGYISRRYKNTNTNDFGGSLQKQVEDFAEKYINNKPYL
jgi:hypothetical protein